MKRIFRKKNRKNKQIHLAIQTNMYKTYNKNSVKSLQINGKKKRAIKKKTK